MINSSGSPAYSEGNLVITPDGSNYSVYQSTIPVSSGKWYAEYLVGDTNTFAGVSSADQSASAYGSYWDNTSADFIFLNNNNGNKIIDGAATSYGTGATVGQIVGVAIDLDGNAINFYVNNSAQGSISFSGGVASASSFVFSGVGYAADAERWNFGQDSSFSGAKTAQGNGDDGEDFYYTPPTGYKALNTNNLDDSAIALPTAHFNTNLWTGNGSTGQSINVGFQPDLLIAKERTTATYVSARNSVTGVTKSLFTGLTNAEYTETNGVTAFTSTGFNLSGDGYGYVNRNTYTYVGWNWKAGGTASSNGNGSITSSVSANPTAGFSIVSYTGQSAAGTIGHGLSQAPEMIILKNRDQGVFWAGYVEALGNTKSISINDTGAAYTEKTWNDTSPTSTVFSIGAQSETSSGRFNVAGEDFIAYCFSSIEGYSKIGTYSGNNSTDGTFVYLGFTPAFILLKTYDNTDNWNIYDIKRNGYNGTGGTYQIRADTNQAGFSAAATMIDLVSNGVKMRTNDPGTNSARNYLYMAFAESPFKTSNAR